MAAKFAAGQSLAIDGVLVLRNGNVLSGAVRRLGDNYRIDVAGATMQLPADQVEMFAPSLDDAYEARRRARIGTSADSHVEMARWCLHLGLLDHAARELLDARTLDPSAAGLPALELRLRQMLDLTQAPPANRVVPDANPPSGGASAKIPDEPPVEISAAARIQFVRSIQPMLLRSCAAAGCHHPSGAQHFQLDRWALQGNGNADIVRRNLAAVLGEISHDDPASSPLLQWARKPHGRPAGKGSPLTGRQEELLIQWINQAAGVDPADASHTADATDNPGEGMRQAESPASTTGPALNQTSKSITDEKSSFSPRDAFDPEIFNREAVRRASLAMGDETAELRGAAKTPNDEPANPKAPSQSPD